MSLSLNKKIRDTIYGVLAGDALGNPVQFLSREEVKQNPVTEMRDGGVYEKPAGTFTDDGSMTLALADSLGLKGELDYNDIMDKFSAWCYKNHYTPYGERAFDMGGTCMEAIFNYRYGIDPLKCGPGLFENNGNGSLMRIAPLVFYIYKKFGFDAFKKDEAFDVVRNVSSLTHSHNIACLGCMIYIALLLEILRGTNKAHLRYEALQNISDYLERHPEISPELNRYARISKPEFIDLPESEINSSGYVVHTLEAALWCFLNTESYEECLLLAVNLGADADSVGAVAGGLAGLYYSGTDKELPKKWFETVRDHQQIDSILAGFCKRFGE